MFGALFANFVVPALLPALADGFRNVVARFTGSAGAQPQNVDESIALMNAQTERLKALAALDTPTGAISLWVANLRASFRYIAVGCIVLSTVAGVFIGVDAAALAVLLDLTGACMSFIIGERMYLGLRK